MQTVNSDAIVILPEQHPLHYFPPAAQRAFFCSKFAIARSILLYSNRCTLHGTCGVSGLSGPLSIIPASGSRNVQAARLPSTNERFTIVAIRCGTLEADREQQAQHCKRLRVRKPRRACYPNHFGWEVRGQQVRAFQVVGLPLWKFTSEDGSALIVVVIAAMRTRRANPLKECVSGQCDVAGYWLNPAGGGTTATTHNAGHLSGTP